MARAVGTDMTFKGDWEWGDAAFEVLQRVLHTNRHTHVWFFHVLWGLNDWQNDV